MLATTLCFFQNQLVFACALEKFFSENPHRITKNRKRKIVQERKRTQSAVLRIENQLARARKVREDFYTEKDVFEGLGVMVNYEL